MPPFTFRCPNTDFLVQGYASDETSDDDTNTCEAVHCIVCKQFHLVNPASGKVLGQRDELVTSAGCDQVDLDQSAFFIREPPLIRTIPQRRRYREVNTHDYAERQQRPRLVQQPRGANGSIGNSGNRPTRDRVALHLVIRVRGPPQLAASPFDACIRLPLALHKILRCVRCSVEG